MLTRRKWTHEVLKIMPFPVDFKHLGGSIFFGPAKVDNCQRFPIFLAVGSQGETYILFLSSIDIFIYLSSCRLFIQRVRIRVLNHSVSL